MARSSCSTAAILVVFLALTNGAAAQLAGGQSVINLLLGGSQSPSPAASTPAPSAPTPSAATSPVAGGDGSTPAAPTPAATAPTTPSSSGGLTNLGTPGSGPSTPVSAPAGSNTAPGADTAGPTPSATTTAGNTPGAPTPASTPSTTPSTDSPAAGTPAPAATAPTAAGGTPAPTTAGSDGASGPSVGSSAPLGSTGTAPLGGTPAATPPGAAPSTTPTGSPTGSETVGSPAGAASPPAIGTGEVPSAGLGAGTSTPPATSPATNTAGFEGLPGGATPSGVGTSPTAAGNNTGGMALGPVSAPTANVGTGNGTASGSSPTLGGVVFAPGAQNGGTSNSTVGPTPSAINPTPTGNATGGPLAGGSAGSAGPAPTVQLTSPPARNLPPAPPADWASLPTNIALVLMMEIRGKYITPWTSPKSYVVSKVLHDRYLMSTQLSDISIQLLNSFSYLSYDLSTPSRRRTLLSMGRSLLQQEKSGVQLKIAVLTNTARTNSEISSLMVGIVNGTLVSDITAAGVAVENVTMTEPPKTVPVDEVNSVPTEESSGFKTWMVGVIVVGVLLVLPLPIYCLVRVSRRRRRAAIERQQAEVAAARARAQSRILKPKSFTLSHASHNIMVRSGPASIASSQAYRLGSARSLRSQGSLDNHSVRSVRFQQNPSFSHDGGHSSPGLPPSFTLPSPESLRSQYNLSPGPTAESREDASIVEIYASGEEGRRSRTTSPR